MLICEPCQRRLDGMSDKAFLSTSFGHTNCTSEKLVVNAMISRKSGAKFCLCYSQGHPDKLVREDPTELPEEYTSHLDQLRKGEEDEKNIKAELQQREIDNNEEEVVKST